MKILCVLGKYNYGDPSRGEGYEFTNFLPALRALGHEVLHFDSWDRSAHCDFAELNRAFLRIVALERPELIFCVLLGYELWTETLDIVRASGSTTIINWGTDDSWKYEQFARFIAPHVDCYATTDPKAFEHAHQDGINNFVLTQWAASRDQLVNPLPARHCKYPVTFVGSAYGNRKKWIATLRARGIKVECFGHGWPAGAVTAQEVSRIYRESVLTLNFGDSGLHIKGLFPYRSRQIKARAFEVPGAGGFLLTENAEGLDRFYRVSEEIVVYEGISDLGDKIAYFLSHQEERDRIALAGHVRTRSEHTYEARFERLLKSVPQREEVTGGGRFDFETFGKLVETHQVGWFLKLVRLVLLVPCIVAWGRGRGPRAARRLLFELSWRVCGKKTYSASGLVGRMFYQVR